MPGRTPASYVRLLRGEYEDGAKNSIGSSCMASNPSHNNNNKPHNNLTGYRYREKKCAETTKTFLNLYTGMGTHTTPGTHITRVQVVIKLFGTFTMATFFKPSKY